MKVHLLLPAKDEAQALSRLLPQARQLGMEVVVCDDGSQDGTGEVARKLGALVLAHGTNRGLAEALRTLFRWAVDHLENHQVVLTMDADGTMPLEGGEKVVEALLLTGSDIAIGSRFRPGGGEVGVPPLRRALSLGARWYLSLTAGIPGVSDYTTGLRAYRVGFLRQYEEVFPFYFRSKGFSAQTELLVRAYHRLGARVVEVGVPILYHEKAGASKMRVLRTAKEYLHLGMWALLERKRASGRKPLRAG